MLKLHFFSLLAVSLFWGCTIGFFDEGAFEKCNGEKYTAANQICENGILKSLCGNSYYDSKMQFCFDSAIYDMCNGRDYNYETHICENDVLFLKCGGKAFDPALEYCANNIIIEKEIFIDNRDNKKYTYVSIGSQIWMAENLQYNASNAKFHKDFGMYYDWNTAKTACPLGWHLPGDAEWNALRDFADSSSIGTKLKANSDLWTSGKGTDDFGFTALPGGFYKNGFEQMWKISGFWSATAGTQAESAHFHFLIYNKESLLSEGFYTSSMANVRCIKDL
jgi:uncharacterized protein (TIGR02145 family)